MNPICNTQFYIYYIELIGIFLVYPTPSYIANVTHGRRGKNNPISFAKLIRQKIAVPTEFLLPHYIWTKQKHFLNLFKTVEA